MRLIIEAFRTLGRDHITEETIGTIRSSVSDTDRGIKQKYRGYARLDATAPAEDRHDLKFEGLSLLTYNYLSLNGIPLGATSIVDRFNDACYVVLT